MIPSVTLCESSLVERTFGVALDPRLMVSAADLDASFALQMKIHHALDRLESSINQEVIKNERQSIAISEMLQHHAAHCQAAHCVSVKEWHEHESAVSVEKTRGRLSVPILDAIKTSWQCFAAYTTWRKESLPSASVSMSCTKPFLLMPRYFCGSTYECDQTLFSRFDSTSTMML